jgi:KamA family protein
MISKTLTVLANAVGKPVEEIEMVANKYPFALTPFLVRRVEEGTYSTAALRQFVPDALETNDVDGFSADPTHEEDIRPEDATLQAYDNRLLIMLSYHCLVYCRFCFRKAFVGFPEHTITEKQLDKALAYLASHPQIEDVVLSGGDPLAVPNRKLLPFLKKLTAISHVKAIRIDSRALSTHPTRIDDELIDFLNSDGRFWYHAHMNHPDDINHPDVIAAVRRLLSAGVPVFNQSVILHGVNDDVETMTRLMMSCYRNKVIPYNLYLIDHVKGAAHFDVPNDRIVEICAALSRLSGPAQPVLVYVDERSKKHRAVYDDPADLLTFLARRDAFLVRNAKKEVPVLSGV